MQEQPRFGADVRGRAYVFIDGCWGSYAPRGDFGEMVNFS